MEYQFHHIQREDLDNATIDISTMMGIYCFITNLPSIVLVVGAIYYIKLNRQLRSELNTTRSELNTTQSVTYSFFKGIFKTKKQELIDIAEKSNGEAKDKILNVVKMLDALSFITKDPESKDEVKKFKEEIVHINTYIKSITKQPTISCISEKIVDQTGFEALYMNFLIATLDEYTKEIKIKI